MGNTKDVASRYAKNKGLKSLATMVVLVVFMLIAVTALCLGGLGIYFLSQSMTESAREFEAAKNQDYRTEIKSQVQSAISLVQGFYDRAAAGEFSEEEAKDRAAEAVRGMRYRDDNSGYVWIDAVDGTLVMHPILTDQEGTNRIDMTDPNGVKITQGIIDAAESGDGFHEFSFTKADGVTVAPKIAYGQKFEAWGWVVATGNYVDDMNEEIEIARARISRQFSQMMTMFGVAVVLILVTAFVVSLFFGTRLTKGIQRIESHLHKTAEGDLSFELEPKLMSRADEIGRAHV